MAFVASIPFPGLFAKSGLVCKQAKGQVSPDARSSFPSWQSKKPLSMSLAEPPTSPGLNPVETTGLLTLYWRSRESRKPEHSRLICDEPAMKYVDTIMESSLKQSFENSKLVDLCTDLLAIRTKEIDHVIDSWFGIVDPKQKKPIYYQMVCLGVGMCTRHYRLPNIPQNAVVFELDTMKMLEERVDMLAQTDLKPKCLVEAVVCDDLGREYGLLEALSWRGYRPDLPTIFVAEGLLEYLSAEQLDNLFGSLARIAADGSRFIAQVLEPKIHEHFMELDPSYRIPFNKIPSKETIVGHMNGEAIVWHDVEFQDYAALGERMGRETIPGLGYLMTAAFLYEDPDAAGNQ